MTNYSYFQEMYAAMAKHIEDMDIKQLYQYYVNFIKQESTVSVTQAGLMFGYHAIKVPEVYSHDKHNIDQIREHLHLAAAEIIKIFSANGTVNLLEKVFPITELEIDPDVLLVNYISTTRVILHHLATSPEGSRIDRLAENISTVDKFIDITIRLGKYTSLKDFMLDYFEFHTFWVKIMFDKNAHMLSQQHLAYPMRKWSVFP